MDTKYLDDILPLVRQPSHYLGSEINAIKKDPKQVRLHFALVFPELYEIGMSYQGTQILYHILNSKEEIAAERVFAPGVDLEAELRGSGRCLRSLESGTALSDFDILGFSLLYELTFTNILTILSLSDIPFFSKDRDDSHPLIIAGGPCAFNPEPLADFFDVVVIGDGEEVVELLVDKWLEWKNGGGDRQTLLEEWSQMQGVYVPSFFEVGHDSRGGQVLTPRFSNYTSICKAVVPDLNDVSYPDRPLVPFGKPIHDRLSLEICRGCSGGCRFCQAGMIYRPVRERSPEGILSLAKRALINTGYEDVSLLSLSTGDYGALQGLITRLMNRCEPEKIALSLPSLRVGSLTPPLMTQIKRVRKTGFTIAPEAGSQRLRDVINKNITEEALLKTVEDTFALGWQRIKLYFMIGLPTETDHDLTAIVKLVRQLKKLCGTGKGRQDITVSVSTFVPKSHTPFQWCSQVPLEESQEKIFILKNELKVRGIRFKWQNPKMSLLEGLWARGDRSLSRLLVAAHEMSCRFDAWSDHFNFARWQAAIGASGVDIDLYTRSRAVSEPLPWDHIASGVSSNFLKIEWEKAISANSTPDCRHGECSDCGVCDFDRLKPVIFKDESYNKASSYPKRVSDKTMYRSLRVSYAKEGPARYFGHLELAKILERAFRRAQIPLRFSSGFHPVPKISFKAALPVGVESKEEHFFVEVPPHIKIVTLEEGINTQLPEGLRIYGCKPGSKKSEGDRCYAYDYAVTLRTGHFSRKKIERFLDCQESVITKTTKKGLIKTIDLKQLITKLQLVSPKIFEMTLDFSSGRQVRPTEVIKHLFELSERDVKLARIVKRPASEQNPSQS